MNGKYAYEVLSVRHALYHLYPPSQVSAQGRHTDIGDLLAVDGSTLYPAFNYLCGVEQS